MHLPSSPRSRPGGGASGAGTARPTPGEVGRRDCRAVLRRWWSALPAGPPGRAPACVQPSRCTLSGSINMHNLRYMTTDSRSLGS
ncbi:hypothetical protein Ae406Ps2_0608c [Pseudonocardia sp. Ae406_Ps2]|nr:hypothetical protein Ae406Ps2_0608c [Pseudonocardia sp. Ae406_Ps2]OLM07601.1 hypothetical protein Ae331Ps2_5311 [Pseudonocardia sp. Ae331_Ps2]